MLASAHYADGGTTRAARYQAFVLAEETLELAGAATLVLGLARRFARTTSPAGVRFVPEPVQIDLTDATTSATAATSFGTRS